MSLHSKKHWLTGISQANTIQHELKKLEVATRLVHQEKCSVLLEPILKNNKRPDVLVMDTRVPIAYEIMVSETEERVAKKQDDYMGIKINKVKV